MKHVGIITFHRAMNLGAMLQAFALEQVLSEKYDAQIIDYRGTKIESQYYRKTTFMSLLKGAARYFLKHNKAKFINRKNKNFRKFLKKYLNTTDAIYTVDNITEVNKEFDAIIAGSDQVWNTKLTDNDLNYFLQFVEPSKRFSYAGSFGNETDIYEAKNIELITELLSTIKRPLIREYAGFSILKNLNVKTSGAAELVCDPIFLLPKEEWIRRLELRKLSEDYILLFIVAPEINGQQFARKLQAQYGFPIKYIKTYSRFGDCPEGFEDCSDAGPREFLELLLNARFVVTTSFHGMAFSINFNKNFYYELDISPNARNDRLINLAELFMLEDREILSADQDVAVTEIDYKIVNMKLKEYSDNSKSILFNSLKDI